MFNLPIFLSHSYTLKYQRLSSSACFFFFFHFSQKCTRAQKKMGSKTEKRGEIFEFFRYIVVLIFCCDDTAGNAKWEPCSQNKSKATLSYRINSNTNFIHTRRGPPHTTTAKQTWLLLQHRTNAIKDLWLRSSTRHSPPGSRSLAVCGTR